MNLKKSLFLPYFTLKTVKSLFYFIGNSLYGLLGLFFRHV
jgi:hypothetical protein